MKLLFFCGLVLFVFNSSSWGSTSSKSMSVLSTKGKPLIEKKKDESGSLIKSSLKKDEKIRGYATVYTDAQSEVVLQLEAGVELKIYPESEVHFPLIRWEDGKINEFILRQGKVRWQAQAASSIQLKSDLFESSLPEGIFVAGYNHKVPEVELMVFQGSLNFQEKNGEETVKIDTGKKVQFMGQKEDGEIAYDVLLHGRKIPKGHRSEIQDLTPDDLKLYSVEAEKKAAEASKKKASAGKGKAPARKNEICKNPGGIFNECRWVCANNPKEQSRCRLDLSKVRCVRSRCNANGEWAESFELTRSAGENICKAYPVVQACDY